MKLFISALFLLFSCTAASACLSWEVPDVDFEGQPLAAAIEEAIVYVADAQDETAMVEVVRVLMPKTDTKPSKCSDIGLTPHKWACVKFAYAQGVSECAWIERVPPGQGKVKVIE